jgi:hypothetical protein
MAPVVCMMWISLFAFAPAATPPFLASHRADNDTGRSGQRLNAAGADGRDDFVGAEFAAEG